MSRDNDHSRKRLFSFRPPPIRDNNPWTFVSLGSNPTSGSYTSPRPKRPHLLGNRHTVIKFVFSIMRELLKCMCWQINLSRAWIIYELLVGSDGSIPMKTNKHWPWYETTDWISELVSGPHTIWHNAPWRSQKHLLFMLVLGRYLEAFLSQIPFTTKFLEN